MSSVRKFAVVLIGVATLGCGGGTIRRESLVYAWSEPYQLVKREGVNFGNDRYGTLYGVSYEKEEIAPTDYDEITRFDFSKDLVLGRRHDSHKLDVILLRERKVVKTDFVQAMLSQNAYVTVLFGAREPDPRTGRQEIVVMDNRAREWSTLYATKGLTRLYVYGRMIVMDSVDEQGKPFSSLHDRYGTPISPKLLPLVHTQRETLGRYQNYAKIPVRLPARIVLRREKNGVFDARGNQPSIAIGKVPEKTRWDAFDRVIVRPILEDGTLAPIPKGALGFIPLNLAGDYWRKVAGAVSYAPMHTQWCVVYPTETGFQFAVGKGNAAEVALQAEAGALPVYDELDFVDPGTFDPAEFREDRKPAGYAARLVSTGRWVHFDAETGEVVARGDNLGQGYATKEEARLLRTAEEARLRAQEEAEARQKAIAKAAVERARAERERAAWEADRPRREAEARARAAQAEAQRTRAEDEVLAKVSKLPHFPPTDPTRRYYMDAQAVRWNVHALRSARVWTEFLTRYGAIDDACIAEARSVGVSAAVLAAAEAELRTLREAEDARNRARNPGTGPSPWDEMAKALDGMSRPGVTPAGSTYLQQIGYENITKQNTQAWSNGANPWGRSWAPK